MSGLVPEPRVDKTGKTVIRHVRPSQQASTSSRMPAPKLGAQVPTRLSGSLNMSKKPSKKQLEAGDERSASRYAFPASKELVEVLEPPASASVYYFTASDITIYEMLSCLQAGTAFYLMDRGINTPEAAREFLSDHGLERLIVDRSAVVSEAADRRIGALNTADFLQTYGRTHTSEVILDAAEAQESRALEKFGLHVDISESILGDKLSLSELRTVGFARLAKVSDATMVREQIEAIHRGEKNYTIDQFAKIVAASERQSPKFMEQLLQLAEKYGGDYFESIKHPFRAAVCIQNSDGRIDDEVRDLISYDDTIMRGGEMLNVESMRRLMSERIPAEDAVKMTIRGLTVDQMVATHAHGINLAVSDGWL